MKLRKLMYLFLYPLFFGYKKFITFSANYVECRIYTFITLVITFDVILDKISRSSRFKKNVESFETRGK